MVNTVTDDLLATLDARYKALKAEMEEVRRLKAAIKTASGQPAKKPRTRARNPEDGPTFKDMIKVVLAEKGDGADALEIIDLIKDKFNKTLMRTSISPQLSRMKANGDLVLEDKVWFLPQHYEKKELPQARQTYHPPIDGPPSASASDAQLASDTSSAMAAASASMMIQEEKDKVWDGNLLPGMPGYRPNHNREPRSFVLDDEDPFNADDL